MSISPAARVEQLIAKGEEVLRTHRPLPPNTHGFPTLDSGAFSAWRTQSLAFLCDVLSTDHPYYDSFSNDIKKAYTSTVKSGIGILRSVLEDLNSGVLAKSAAVRDPIDGIVTLCERFQLVARQFRKRQRGRQPLAVEDEYDVQDIMHGLLWLFFEDVRAEEWTPSYAGKASRMDFLLKREGIVVECKKTRQGLESREIGSELIEDIARYQAHPECRALVCFVYDPEARIANPRGIESDLSRSDTGFPVRVLIRPQ